MKEPINKALIFDLDGTLVLTEQYHSSAFESALAPYSISYSYKEHIENYSGRGTPEIIEIKLKEAGQPLSLLPKLAKTKKVAYQMLIDRLGAPVVNGVKAFIRKAYSAKIILAVATSNTREGANRIVRAIGCANYFKTIATRDDVKRAKPYPDIFLAAAREIGIKPDEAVVFEDSPRGIEAASRGGFATVGLTTSATKTALLAKGADLIIKDYTALSLSEVLHLSNRNKQL